MELGLRLTQKQTLKLVMTPRLQQALKLLQMPSLELSQHIDQELLTNPLLEVEEDEVESPASEVAEAALAETIPGEESATSPDDAEFKSEENIDWSEYFDDGFEYAEGGRAEREDQEFFERTPVGRTTLLDSLHGQLRLLDLDEETERVAEYLLGCLDDHGFLSVTVEEVAAQLAVPEEMVLTALEKIQELEPVGVGARDLTESLRIQLRQRGRQDSLAGRIVADHFGAFKQKQYQEIARALGVTPSDVQEAAREIASLNPRPGAQLALEDARYIVPDLVVEKIDDAYVVSLAEGTVPRLRVNRKYREILRASPPPTKRREPEPGADGAGSPAASDPAAGDGQARDERARSRDEEVKFVQDKIKSANWLIQTIEQRRRTMIKVMESIVEAQIDFFEKGPAHLRPLTLQDVAERIGMHESTVSRVTTNKYVQIPRGVFPLKYFFSSGLETESGQSVSSKMAMARIRELIDKEDKKKPLSDQKIAELLREEGLIVARRTVAKYREKMNILSARYRKEF
jgi:RNA polymerase sigma-54 factor